MRTSVIGLLLFLLLSACTQAPVKIDNFAITEQAFALEGQGKYEEAYNLLKPLADQGVLDAIYRLAELYDYNTSLMSRIKQNPYYNPQKARELLYISAKQGHAYSQLALGSNLRRRLNDYRDKPEEFRAIYKEACEWSVKGAMQGTKLGTYPVARCYRNGGFTGTRDYMMAYAWFAVPNFYQVKDGIYEDFDDDYFMDEVAKRGKLTDTQKQQALKIARDIAAKIVTNMKKKKPNRTKKQEK